MRKKFFSKKQLNSFSSYCVWDKSKMFMLNPFRKHIVETSGFIRLILIKDCRSIKLPVYYFFYLGGVSVTQIVNNAFAMSLISLRYPDIRYHCTNNEVRKSLRVTHDGLPAESIQGVGVVCKRAGLAGGSQWNSLCFYRCSTYFSAIVVHVFTFYLQQKN